MNLGVLRLRAQDDMLIRKAAEERLLLRRWEDNELNPSVHGDIFGGFEH